ncbi:NAD-dependent DNA ligase LigA [Fusobacterium sp. PH5-44]|uniref:NAD-dependent DNA ligase LigA n=1 Tax=unclassified Fusobacterium TaxID=2648384 RepID=UPI003D1CE0FD
MNKIDVNFVEIKNKITELRKEIDEYNDQYYSLNRSIVSDFEYDLLLKELENLETAYPQFKNTSSPSVKVGSSLKDTKFSKVLHNKPMLSLGNSYNIGDITNFISKIVKNLTVRAEKLDFALELKLDGASISIQYVDGELVRGITRGDGIEGEDVTENILAIKSIPKYLNEKISLEVRGEIVLPKSKFIKLNQKRMDNGEEIFANPRNAASGTLRQLDPNIVAERNLDAYFYFLVDAEKYNIKTHYESLKYIERLGIKTTGICEVISSVEKIEERLNYWEIHRETLDYETDGMVIKLNEINMWEEIGYTTKSPRWAIAYKFMAKQVSTRLNGITWQVGRTGKLTPVAELVEVELSGSKVKRASLHNIDEIKRKDIRVGDMVFIEKAAEIIPQVVSSIKDVRTGEEKIIDEPQECPSCGHKLIKEEGLVDLKCINPVCPAIIQGVFEYFVSRDGMNISGLGTKIVEKFLELGYIKDITDIYTLKNYKSKLIELEKMGEKSVDNLLEAIEASKARAYSKTLYALGIPYVGKFLANLLSKQSKNIDVLARMTIDELLSIDGVGEKVGTSVYEFFRNEKNIEIINKLKNYGVNFSIEENKDKSSELNVSSEVLDKFRNKTFLFTGKLEKFKREDIKDIVEALGGTNLSGVSKKLDYLIVGTDAGSKLEKAREIGTVNILTEAEFINLCGNKIK